MATAMTVAVSMGCSRDVSLLPPGPFTDDAGAIDTGPMDAHADAGAVDGVPFDVGAFIDAGDAGDAGATCPGPGNPISFPTSAGPACAAALSARGHRFALCSCDSLDLSSTAPIHTDSFNSSTTGTASGTAAAIGVGGMLTASAEVWAGGALYVTSGIATIGHIEASRSLRVGSSMVIINTDAHVAGDAYLDGAVSGVLRFDGIVHQPPGFGSDPVIPETSIRREVVSVPRPCDCSSGFVDLTGAVSAAVAKNDNAVAGLSEDALAALKVSTLVNVSCGTFVLSGINAAQPLVFAAHGRSLFVVTGDVVVSGGFIVVLDPGAEVDLLIGGRLIATGGGALGSASPARFRIWVAGTGSVVLDDAPTVGAMLHVPNAAVMASSGLKISGGLFARSVLLGGQLDLHFDEAVLSSGASCGEPAETPVP